MWALVKFVMWSVHFKLNVYTAVRYSQHHNSTSFEVHRVVRCSQVQLTFQVQSPHSWGRCQVYLMFQDFHSNGTILVRGLCNCVTLTSTILMFYVNFKFEVHSAVCLPVSHSSIDVYVSRPASTRRFNFIASTDVRRFQVWAYIDVSDMMRGRDCEGPSTS